MHHVDFDELERRILSRTKRPSNAAEGILDTVYRQSVRAAIEVLKEYEEMKQENQPRL